MESTGETWLTVLQHKAQRGWYRRAEWYHPLWKGGKSIIRPRPAGGASKCDAFNFFGINKECFILECLKSCFAAIMYQIKHYFDFSNCNFTRSFLISAIWRGSPCPRSSDDANTDWVHYLSPCCRVKWQTVLPAISSQRRRDVGCATATVATDANVVPMSLDIALLAGMDSGPDERCVNNHLQRNRQ